MTRGMLVIGFVAAIGAGGTAGAQAPAPAGGTPPETQTQAPAGGTPAIQAQAPAMEKVTLREAIQRAIQRNPSAAIAAAGILRAEALLRQARASTLPVLSGTVTTTTLNTGTRFDSQVVTPRNQLFASLDVTMPLIAPALWARRAQAKDQREIADVSAEESRRQTALATADAYLTVITNRRVVEANERARDVAKAHFDVAQQRQQAGMGSRLNELRAQEEVTSDEVLVESARLALYRAQEALGVLLVADGPVDAGEEPTFEEPPAPLEESLAKLTEWRPDLKLFAVQEAAADRIVRDSAKDYLPSLQGVFQPQAVHPSPFFLRSRSWRAILQLSVPIYDSGQRAATKEVREASLAESRATLTGAVTQAKAELRAAHEAVRSAARSVASARNAAEQAARVVEIVNVSYRAGAATNIEVIDAERRARDADTAAAIAEDALRRARLEVLTAMGRFP